MPLHPGLVPNGQQLMCPCVFARRGYISLQVLWHLVPKWAEPASPLDVLLQWEAKRSRSGVGRERRQCSSDFQPVPLPAVHQELFQCPSTRNAPELAQRWALPFFLLGLWQTLPIHICHLLCSSSWTSAPPSRITFLLSQVHPLEFPIGSIC